MTDQFANALFITLFGSAFMFLAALVARRLEKHLDRQDKRIGRIERYIFAIMARLNMVPPPSDELETDD